MVAPLATLFLTPLSIPTTSHPFRFLRESSRWLYLATMNTHVTFAHCLYHWLFRNFVNLWILESSIWIDMTQFLDFRGSKNTIQTLIGKPDKSHSVKTIKPYEWLPT